MHAFSHFVFSLVSYISLALCSSHALSQIQVIVFTHQVSSVKRFQFHVIRQAIFMPYLKLDRSTQEWTMSCRDRCLFRLLSTTFSGNLHTIGSLYVNTNIKKFFKDMKHGFFRLFRLFASTSSSFFPWPHGNFLNYKFTRNFWTQRQIFQHLNISLKYNIKHPDAVRTAFGFYSHTQKLPNHIQEKSDFIVLLR